MPLGEAAARHLVPLGRLIITMVDDVLAHKVTIKSVMVLGFSLLRN